MLTFSPESLLKADIDRFRADYRTSVRGLQAELRQGDQLARLYLSSVNADYAAHHAATVAAFNANHSATMTAYNSIFFPSCCP
jgi:hypothetical protein